MRTDPATEKDVLQWALAGCNAAEVAAYTGTSEMAAQARMIRALRNYAQPPPQRDTLRLAKRPE